MHGFTTQLLDHQIKARAGVRTWDRIGVAVTGKVRVRVDVGTCDGGEIVRAESTC